MDWYEAVASAMSSRESRHALHPLRRRCSGHAARLRRMLDREHRLADHENEPDMKALELVLWTTWQHPTMASW